MRITLLSLIFVAAVCLGGLAGCKEEKASQPAASTKNTINSTTVQSSDSDLLKYEKEKDAQAAAIEAKRLAAEKAASEKIIKNGPKNGGEIKF